MGFNEISIFDSPMDIVAEDCVDLFCKLTHHIGLGEHDEFDGFGSIFGDGLLWVYSFMDDLNFEIGYFLDVEDMIGRDFENHFLALIDRLFSILDIFECKSAEVAMESDSVVCFVDGDGGAV